MSKPGNALNLTSSGIVKFDGTSTFSGVSVTQYDLLLGGASNGITSIGPGTAGQVVLSGGASSNASFVTPTAGTGLTVTSNASTFQYGNATGYNNWVLIQSQTVGTAVAAINFTSSISSTYNNYFLLGSNITASTSSPGNLAIQISSNGGSSYINTGYMTGTNSFAYNASSFTNTTSTTQFFLYPQTDNTYYSSMALYFYDFTSGKKPLISGNCSRIKPTSTQTANMGLAQGGYNTATAMNAFTIYFDGSVNIATGTFTLYGIVQ